MNKTDFKCECGSESFHVFMRYKSKDIERMRCKKCEMKYEKSGQEYSKIDSEKFYNIDRKAFKKGLEEIMSNR